MTTRICKNSYEIAILTIPKEKKTSRFALALGSLVWCSSDVSLFHGKWLSGTGTRTKSRQTHTQPLDIFCP